MTTLVQQPCARGCHYRNRHERDCTDTETCRGCLPKPAEHGLLCYTCHLRLAEAVQTAPAQIELLMGSLEHPTRPDLSAVTTAKIPTWWRYEATSADGETIDAVVRAHAKVQPPGGHASEPLRVAAMDAADEVRAVLSEIVATLADALDAVPPTNRAPATRRVWREASEVRDEGGYVDIEPDPDYDPQEARRWLVGNLGRWEQHEMVVDHAETLWQVMSQAHALAPWREEPTRIPGIPCPYCHRHGLRLFGGREEVTCTVCRTDIPSSRYLLWARMLEEEAG